MGSMHMIKTADSIDAVYRRMLEEVAAAEHVFADETPLRAPGDA